MPSQYRADFPGALHHVYSRGNRKQPIFRTDRDRFRFLEILAEVIEIHGFRLHAYVLMTNHYHLLIRTPRAGLSRGIHKLNTSYVKWFNHKHREVGHVFQGRFQNVPVTTDRQYLVALRYIALNPVTARLVRDPCDWKWSSHRATAGYIPPPDYLDVDSVLLQFDVKRNSAVRLYREFVFESWDSEFDPHALTPADDRIERCESYAETILFDVKLMTTLISNALGISPSALRTKSTGPARKLFAQCAYELGATQREIGRRLGISAQAASKLVRAGAELAKNDAAYRQALEEIRSKTRDVGRGS